MPSTTVRNCRRLVQGKKNFRASTMQGVWTTAKDETNLYVVYSTMTRKRCSPSTVVLFVWDGQNWYESMTMPNWSANRRFTQMRWAQPVPNGQTIRVERHALTDFVTQGMECHPNIHRLLKTCV